MSCIFCDIIASAVPAKKIYETEQVIAFEDIHKVAPVHVLVVPKKHIQSILDIAPGDTELMAELQKAILAITAEMHIADSGFRLISNSGKSAGQTVFHLHYHIIGGRNLSMAMG